MASWSRRLVRYGNRTPNVAIPIIHAAEGVPSVAASVFRRVPTDSIIKRADGLLVAKKIPLRMDEIDTLARAGNHRRVFDALGTPLPDATRRVLDSNSLSKFPDVVPYRKQLVQDDIAVKLVRKGESPNTSSLITRQTDIDQFMKTNGVVNNVQSTLATKLKKVAKFTLVTGAVVGVGLYLYSHFEKAIALNSGCFLLVKTTTKVEWRRIIGYSCSDIAKLGDEEWLAQGLPISTHPFQQEIEQLNLQCPNSSDTCFACNLESLASAGIDTINMPENSSLLCRTSSIWDVLDDVAKQVGEDVAKIITGAGKGLFGGLTSTTFGKLVLLLGGVVLAGLGYKGARSVTNSTPIAATVSVLIFIIVLLFVYTNNKNNG